MKDNLAYSANHVYREGFDEGVAYAALVMAETPVCPISFAARCTGTCVECWLKTIKGAIKDYEETQHPD